MAEKPERTERSDEEAIVDFVKEHEKLYDKTNEHLKDKAGKECPLGDDRQQLQALCKSIQDLLRIAKDTLRQTIPCEDEQGHHSIEIQPTNSFLFFKF